MLFTSDTSEPLLSQRRDFVPLLKIIATYPFPKPQNASKTYKKDWVHFEVMTFTDAILLNALDPKRNSAKFYEVRLDEDAKEQLHFTFRKSRESGNLLVINNWIPFLDFDMLKKLFVEIIYCTPHWKYAVTSLLRPQIYQESFTQEERLTKLPLDWLNYFGKKELEKWNGYEAFEANPYIQTERIHDGLLVQLGNNPNVFDTPEGKMLLMNAMKALPPLSIQQ
jgi:hypothetical protein